jgi:hypothetical protein
LVYGNLWVSARPIPIAQNDRGVNNRNQESEDRNQNKKISYEYSLSPMVYPLADTSVSSGRRPEVRDRMRGQLGNHSGSEICAVGYSAIHHTSQIFYFCVVKMDREYGD